MHLHDEILIVIFFAVQWRITVLLLRMANRRYRGPRLWAARAGVWALDGLAATGCLFNFAEVTGRLKLPGRITLVIGGVVMAYLLTATAVMAIYTILAAVRRRWSDKVDLGRRRVLNAAGNALMASPVAVMGYGALVQRTDFRVREVDLPFPGLAPDLDGLRIVQLSDIHLSAFLTEAELARVIDEAAGLKPHLVVVTGDLISSHGDPLGACIRQIARLKPDAGIFACMGNHERYASAERDAEVGGARVGIRFLRGSRQTLRFGGASLNIAGVDYQPLYEKDTYLAGTEALVAPGALNILLSHNPDVFPVAVQKGYDLLLAGHTHGGQVNIEILERGINPARFFTPYVYGLYREGNASAYVTRGIGTIGIPARIGAPPEISVLRLRKA